MEWQSQMQCTYCRVCKGPCSVEVSSKLKHPLQEGGGGSWDSRGKQNVTCMGKLKVGRFLKLPAQLYRRSKQLLGERTDELGCLEKARPPRGGSWDWGGGGGGCRLSWQLHGGFPESSPSWDGAWVILIHHGFLSACMRVVFSGGISGLQCASFLVYEFARQSESAWDHYGVLLT